MEHIVEASSRPGAVVLDCFMGSGVTGLAALRCRREFIGIERDPGWFAVASERLAVPEFPRRRPLKRSRPLPLFE
jgi:site-specific DNA-methyltransferase (adenine-specific)